MDRGEALLLLSAALGLSESFMRPEPRHVRALADLANEGDENGNGNTGRTDPRLP